MATLEKTSMAITSSNKGMPMLATQASEANAGGGEAGTSRRRAGKEIVKEFGTTEEKKPMVVNLTKARSAASNRFLAVGVFLSVIAISSKNLIDGMKRIWNIRGALDMNQLGDRRFVLEFSEEGDFLHVTRGGPWRFKDNVVLVDALKEGDNPNRGKFNSIPIWTQFRDVPFYLLSKELVKYLGNRVGSLVFIDNNARGDICNKFVRARILLPIDQALRRWVPLMDKITEEEVIVSIAYERLPNFCAFCVWIDHTEQNCELPLAQRVRRYDPELRTAPTHPEDPRCWYLPDFTGQARQRPAPALPWHSNQDHHHQ
ncbi:unnamed protein product [Alopecurus aequalis]